MSKKRTIELYNKKKAQGKYYYQLNGKSAEENYIEILKEKQNSFKEKIINKRNREIEKEIEKQIEEVIEKSINEAIAKTFK